MKIFKQTIALMLVCALGFLASCSDEEDVFYYSFKSIEYTMEEEDGIMTYDTPEEIYKTITNNSSEDLKISTGNIFQGYDEYYVFKCDNQENFNPTVGYVHVPIPGVNYEGNIVLGVGSDMGEYTMEKMVTYNLAAGWKEHVIPPMKKLRLWRTLQIEKHVFTYKATFQRHPKGEDLVVKGKFIHEMPTSAITRESFEDIE